MAITQAELARQLGVSQGTISYAFQANSPINPDTRKKVLEAARKLGYLPNASARSLVKREVGAIGLVTSTTGSQSAITSMLNGIHAAVRELNLHLVVTQLPDPKLTDTSFVPRILTEYAVAGLLIAYTHNVPPKMEELIETFRIPAIWLNNKRRQDCIHPDDVAAGRLATEHLLELGHKRIAYISYTRNEHYSHEDRFLGYAQAMQEAGLTPLDLRAGHNLSHEEIPGHSRRFLSGPDRPTALVAYDPVHALVNAAMAGVRIPQDLSIVSITDGAPNVGGLRVTNLKIPFAPMGEQAVHTLMKRVAARTRSLPPRRLPFQFELRDSTAPPSAAGAKR